MNTEQGRPRKTMHFQLTHHKSGTVCQHPYDDLVMTAEEMNQLPIFAQMASSITPTKLHIRCYTEYLITSNLRSLILFTCVANIAAFAHIMQYHCLATVLRVTFRSFIYAGGNNVHV